MKIYSLISALLISVSGFFLICTANQLSLDNSMTRFQNFKLSKPFVLCQRVENNRNGGYLALSWSWNTTLNALPLFKIDVRNLSKPENEWKFLTSTKKNYIEIKNLQLSFSYQFRLVPVLLDIFTAMPLTSSWIKLKNFSASLSAPRNVQVSGFTFEGGAVTAVVKWNASKESPCFYQVLWFPTEKNDFAAASQTVSLPKDDLSAHISNLPYDVNYTVRITPVAKSVERAESAEARFLTPTCLTLSRSNFSLCDTRAPESLLGVSTYTSGISISSVILILIIVLAAWFKFYKKRPTGVATGVADVNPVIRPLLVPPDRLKLTEVLGQGAFGLVYRGIYRRSKSEEEVAVKVLPAESRTRQQLLREVETMHLVGRHKKVVGLLGFSLEVDRMSLILEYCPLGDLHSYLKRLRREVFRLKSLPALPPSESSKISIKRLRVGKRLCSYIKQVAEGMEYISSLRLIHRDLAARNILMVDEDQVKIADFGLSRDVYETSYYASSGHQKMMPIKWMSPEAIEQQKFTTHSDVWSFGVFMWEVKKMGKEPYPGLPNHQLLEHLKNGYRLGKPFCRDEWYQLMLECWRENPRKRPAFREIVKKVTVIIDKMYQYVVLY